MPTALAADLVPKLLGAHESHGAPPGAYLLSLPATFWPGSIALLFALGTAWRRRRRTPERFLLAWLLPTWIVFECLPTKLPHYVLPTFPALALLAARAVLAVPAHLQPSARHAIVRALAIGWALLTLTLGGAACGAALWLGDAMARGLAAVAVAITIVIAIGCLRRFWAGRVGSATCIALAGAVPLYAVLFAGVLPHLTPLWPSRAASAAIARAGADRPLAAAGYHEPSLVFLTRTDLALLDGGAAAEFLATHRDGLVLVSDAERPALVAAARRRGLELRTRWSSRALNYSRGAWIDLDLIDRRPATTER